MIMRTLPHKVPALLREMTAQVYARLADRWDREAETAIEHGLIVYGECLRMLANQARGTVIEARLGEVLQNRHFETMDAETLARLSGRWNPMWMRAA